ncbi:MAG: hypothetical protein KAG20_06325, partial [Cocleimonas sp.]|nr:hypothetical protein [Cocleimonas sp.]
PTPTPTPTDSLERESNIVSRFDNDYVPYANKAALDPQVLTSGKTVYIVNPGYKATSVPSCVNGKDPSQDCLPTGWKMGMKFDEIYAVRLMTTSVYDIAYINIETNQASGGFARDANYTFNIAERPGDMTSENFKGLCKVKTLNSKGKINITTPDNNKYAKKSWYCQIPTNTAFYLNIELVSDSLSNNSKDSSNNCDNDNVYCSGYFYTNSLKQSQIITDKGRVYDRSGNYLY